MKKLFTFYCLAIAMPLYALPPGSKVVGQVNDDNKKVVEYANITLHRLIDSSFVKSALTDQQGRFEFEQINEGKYFIKVSQVGYQKFQSPSFSVSAENPTVNLKDIEVATDAKALKEVTVRSQKPFIERQLDKLVVNVENSLVSAGASAIEVLERSPGVTVDNDGRVSLRGRSGVIVMIDGKPSQLSASDLGNFLKSMPSNSIEKIEIISNPSAKYDAAGNAGVINIIMKKDQKLGTNGSFTLTAGSGRYEKINTGISLNHRSKKVNLFGSYNYAYRKGFNNLTLYRKFNKDGVLDGVYDQNNYIILPFRNQIPRVGVDFYASKKTTFGAVLSGIVNKYNVTGDNETMVLNGSEQKVGRFTTNNDSKNRWYNYAANFNFKHTFDSTGKEITADFDYARYWNNTDQQFTTHRYNQQDVLSSKEILLGDLGGNLNIRSLKIDYVNPLGKNAKLEAGVKSSFVKSDNNVQFFNKVDESILPNIGLSNHFIYDENINAAYLNYNLKVKNWNWQFGLRGEQTIAKGVQLSTDSSFNRNYFQLFPSLAVNYDANKNNSWGFTMSRRIDRASYAQLNPFKFFVDPTTYREGNPFLLPMLTYSAEISHTYKQTLTTSLNFSRTTDVIASVLLQNDTERVTIQTDRNIAISDYYGVGFVYPKQLTKWWNTNSSLYLWYNFYRGQVANTNLNQGQPSFGLYSTNSFTLPKEMSMELNLNYTHRQVYTISFIEPIWQLSMGVQKQILQKKGTLKLNVTDIFWRNFPRGGTTFANIDETFSSKRDTRVANVAFTYRFGKSTVNPARRRSSGAEDEKSRAGGTNG